MANTTYLGIILAIILVSGTLGLVTVAFADDDDKRKRYLSNSLKKICEKKDEKKLWHCIAFLELKGKASTLIEQVKQNTDDINNLDKTLIPSTLQSCNGTNEILRFTEDKGWRCETLEIPTLECSGHGTVPNDGDTCECNYGFDGKQCEQLVVFPAGSTIQLIPASICDENFIGWCPDGDLSTFKLKTIPGVKFDSALVSTVENSPMGNCNIEFRQTTQMFQVNCLSAPPVDSALKYVVLIP